MWVKISGVTNDCYLFGSGNSAGTGEYVSSCEIATNGVLSIRSDNQNNFTYNTVSTVALFRDPSAWYHIVVAIDTPQANSSDRVKIYVNGVLQSTAGSSYPSQNFDYGINTSGYTQYVGGAMRSGLRYGNGYFTEINFIDGQALTPSSFGETDTITGVWKPKKYAGTYGTNGFYLNFSDNSGTTSTTLGKDSSGNSNNWTPNNFSVTAGAGNDSLIDTPTPYADGGNGRGNYATFAPTIVSSQGTATLANGNLDISGSGSNYTGALSSIAVASGKWYWEYTVNSVGSASGPGIIATTSLSSAAGGTYGFSAASDAWFRYATFIATNNSVPVTGLSSLTTSDVAMIALDVDAGKLWFGRNGTWESSGNPATGANATITFTPGGKSFYAFAQGYGSWSGTFNAGQRPFAYTPPSGFVALNTQNLPEPSIKKPSQWFDVVTRNGFGSSGGSIASLQFQPDFLWNKTRNLVNSHNLIDAVRGVSVGLKSDSTAAEASLTNFLTSFNSNGYTIGTADFATTTTLVDWCWKESATPGFDIVTYTGNASNAARSVAHSLGVAPQLMITKGREAQVTGTDNWLVWHGSFGAGDFLSLNTTSAKSTSSSYWGNTVPTSSNFYVGGTSSNVHNESSKNYVAYLWSEVANFSRFGSYVGNGSSDGPFVFCGFRPRFILFKNANVTGQYWEIYDTARDTYNASGLRLFPNASDNESDVRPEYDILSNGFKVRDSSTSANGNGNTIIFAAFAEAPFKYALAR